MNNVIRLPVRPAYRHSVLRWYDVRTGTGRIIGVLFALDQACHEQRHAGQQRQRCQPAPDAHQRKAPTLSPVRLHPPVAHDVEHQFLPGATHD